MGDDKDNILVYRIQHGDRHAFNALVNNHKKKAFAIAYNFVNNVEDAKELSQEAFVKVYKAIGQFRQGSSFYTWFYRILINLCLDFKKKKRLNVTLFSQFKHKNSHDNGNMVAQVEDKKTKNPLEKLISQEKKKKIEQAISFLPDKQRMVFILRNDEQMSLKEIAVYMDSKEGTIKSHLHRAVKNLQKQFKEEIHE
ncbi:MAG: sigma-70 family RNA polymerase sigma factor [Pseudomonadota bacterium]